MNAADLPVRRQRNGVQVSSWPPGHTGWTDNGCESAQISPATAMRHTLDRIEAKLATRAVGHR